MRPCILKSFSRTSYRKIHELQLKEAQKSRRAASDILIMVEHDPIYTLGRHATMDHVKFNRGERQLQRIERGGNVTYHGPGQLVVYPLINLRHHKEDIKWYVDTLESVMRDTCDHFNISSQPKKGFPGFIGINVKDWITMHGISMNVEQKSVEGFEHIVPCGLDCRVVAMNDYEGGAGVTMDDVREKMASSFQEHFSWKYK